MFFSLLITFTVLRLHIMVNNINLRDYYHQPTVLQKSLLKLNAPLHETDITDVGDERLERRTERTLTVCKMG